MKERSHTSLLRGYSHGTLSGAPFGKIHHCNFWQNPPNTWLGLTSVCHLVFCVHNIDIICKCIHICKLRVYFASSKSRCHYFSNICQKQDFETMSRGPLRSRVNFSGQGVVTSILDYCRIKKKILRLLLDFTLKTLVFPTHKFVFPRKQHLCHIWKTHVCVDLTQVLVLKMTTQVLCDTCSNTPKIFLLPARGELAHHRWVSCPLSYHWHFLRWHYCLIWQLNTSWLNLNI